MQPTLPQSPRDNARVGYAPSRARRQAYCRRGRSGEFALRAFGVAFAVCACVGLPHSWQFVSAWSGAWSAVFLMGIFLRTMARRIGPLVLSQIGLVFGLVPTHVVFRTFPVENCSDAGVVFGIFVGLLAICWGFRTSAVAPADTGKPMLSNPATPSDKASGRES